MCLPEYLLEDFSYIPGEVESYVGIIPIFQASKKLNSWYQQKPSDTMACKPGCVQFAQFSEKEDNESKSEIWYQPVHEKTTKKFMKELLMVCETRWKGKEHQIQKYHIVDYSHKHSKGIFYPRNEKVSPEDRPQKNVKKLTVKGKEQTNIWCSVITGLLC